MTLVYNTNIGTVLNGLNGKVLKEHAKQLQLASLGAGIVSIVLQKVMMVKCGTYIGQAITGLSGTF
jgi:hypothetical protein